MVMRRGIPNRGCKPKPQKIPSAQIQPCHDRIQADDLPSAACVVPVKMDAPVAMQASSSRHMLRHATGYKLANDGQDTRTIQHHLGHRNIQHTNRYTELASDRFKNFRHD